ncbi:glycosyltransferase [Bacillus massilinigeriensis]|uniref:glycosyltransferase n=1 Tax=Bacillus massilionigeriensis TaxID=1805475 RepID=UPI00096B3AC1|nr:glycosyltransferase [Bacillus massilionigeriensis]
MNILVSINCITYNHEKYISDAIEGFLHQKTDFEYEILIGEDCSTDCTREIVEKYAKSYPNLIRVITSSRNVGAAENMRRLFQNSKGKYIALCEGDDYWIDMNKLQKQVDYMENNPDCTLCFHNGIVVEDKNKINDRSVIPWMKNNEKYYFNRSCQYTAGELALLGYIPTASYLYPKHLLEDLPDWCYNAIVGDNVIKLITSSHGYAYYMNECMSVYRFGIGGSATSNWIKENDSIEKKITHCQGFIDLFDNFNQYSNQKFTEEIEKAKKIFEFQIAIIKGDLKLIREERFKENLAELSLREKIKLYSKCLFPKAYTKMAAIKVFLFSN